MKELNKDIETRDKIIFGKYREATYKHGGVREFEGMTRDTLKQLLDQDFADPDERQNLSPTIIEIYEFMAKYPEYTAHGYAVSNSRDDYRVSIDGVSKGRQSDSVKEYTDYMTLFRYCDEFNPRTMYCWFD